MKTKKNKQHAAILTAYEMDSPAMAVYVARWLQKTAASILKETQRRNKGQSPGFSKRFRARLMK